MIGKQKKDNITKISWFLKFFCRLDFQKQIDLTPSDIYVFLGVLTLYELGTDKPHAFFVFFSYDAYLNTLKNGEEWETLSQTCFFSKPDKITAIAKEIFKNNQKSYKWTPEEDIYLKKLLMYFCFSL